MKNRLINITLNTGVAKEVYETYKKEKEID